MAPAQLDVKVKEVPEGTPVARIEAVLEKVLCPLSLNQRAGIAPDDCSVGQR